MTKKIIVCVIVVFLLGLFLACGKRPPPKEEPLILINLDHNWTQITKGESFPWDSIDGFFPNKEHKYGFDRYPVSKQMGKYVSVNDIADSIVNEMIKVSNCATPSCKDEIASTWSPILNHERGMKNTDSIVYISVLKGDSGKVNLKINHSYGSPLKLYNYYICKPNYPYDTISIIDNSQKEIPYTVSSNDTIIALCAESNVGHQKLQELEISSYGWKLYDFYVYILGDSTVNEERQLMRSIEFWNLFDSVYAQAVVKHDSSRLFGEFKTIDGGYVLTKSNGNYPNSCNRNSDIDNAIKEVRTNVKNGGVVRNIIQISYPTKRFWPLRVDGDNNIQICGNPAQNPSVGFNLELETLHDSNCSEKIDAFVKKDKYRNVWRIEYKDGRMEEDATTSNVDPNCMVFAETKKGDYIGEVKILGNDKTLAIMNPYLELSPLSLSLSRIVILPWLNNSTAKTALHELGHSMGLFDIDTISSSYVGKYNNEENNLMTHIGNMKSLKLRKRGVLTIEGIVSEGAIVWEIEGFKYDFRGLEYQWDCLHGISRACALSIY
jgi:hypothetical protein